MPQQYLLIIFLLLAFGAMGVGLHFSIKKHDAKMATMKKKKGRRRYMQEFKKPGR